MAFGLMPIPRQRYFDANDLPLAGGKLYTYAAGTSTPQATFTDASGVTPNTNPIILDADGYIGSCWLSNLSYKIVLKDSLDNVIFTEDDVQLVPDGSIDKTKLASDVAGKGLNQAAGGELDIKYDDVTVEVDPITNKLQLKALGVDTAQLKANSVTEPKLGAGAVSTRALADLSVTPTKMSAVNKFLSGNIFGTSSGVTSAFAQSIASSVTKTISSAVRSSNIVTVTVSASHALSVGQMVFLTSVAGGATSFNGAFVVVSTPTSTTFTFAQTGPNESATASTGSAQYYTLGAGASNAISLARSAGIVTATVALGHNLTAGQLFSLTSTQGGATSFDGNFSVVSVTSTTVFTYAQSGPNESATANYGLIQGILGGKITTSGRPVDVGLIGAKSQQSVISLQRTTAFDGLGATILLARKDGSTPPASATDYTTSWSFSLSKTIGITTLGIASWTISSHVMTITTTAPHGLSVGLPFFIWNSATLQTNGFYVVKTVSSSTVFTVYNPGLDAGPVTSDGIIALGIQNIGSFSQTFAPGGFRTIDSPAAGTYFYFFTSTTNSSIDSVTYFAPNLVVHEL